MKEHILPVLNKKLILPISDRVMNTHIIYYYKWINEMLKASKTEVEDWQNSKLQELMNQAYYHTKYYRKVFDDLNLKPTDFHSITDLKKLPVLTKELINKHYDELIPDNINQIPFHKNSTGGSTGEPLKYFLDNRSWSYTVATDMIYWEKIGYKPGENYIAFGSNSLFPKNEKSLKHSIYYFLKGKIPINAMNMSEELLNDFIRLIARKKIRYLYGYASSIFLLARKVKELDKDFSFINCCITTSEMLLPEYRKMIKDTFDCHIIDAYGASDGGINVNKINEGDYVVGYNCLLEVNSSEHQGPALATDLLNYAMPFIRYEVGDYLSLKPDHLHNYNGQVIDSIMGRVPDIITLKNGRVLTGPGFTILFKDLNVEGYRITQKGPMEILCQIIPNNKYSSEEKELIIKTLKKHAGSDCHVKIEIKSSFDFSASGKRNYFISD